jgi:hypothetical protein
MDQDEFDDINADDLVRKKMTFHLWYSRADWYSFIGGYALK